MAYLLRFTENAINDLSKIDRRQAGLIVDKIEMYTNSGMPFHYAKPLSGRLQGLYRFRIGDYRAIFQKDKNGQLVVLIILHIKHRA